MLSKALGSGDSTDFLRHILPKTKIILKNTNDSDVATGEGIGALILSLILS